MFFLCSPEPMTDNGTSKPRLNVGKNIFCGSAPDTLSYNSWSLCKVSVTAYQLFYTFKMLLKCYYTFKNYSLLYRKADGLKLPKPEEGLSFLGIQTNGYPKLLAEFLSPRHLSTIFLCRNLFDKHTVKELFALEASQAKNGKSDKL